VTTAEQNQVLELLASWTRFLSLSQVSGLFVGRKDPARSARSLVKRLVDKGLVERRTLIARPPVSVTPLLTFYQGDETPDFKAVSRNCRGRWTEPAQVTEVVQLSHAGAKAFGVLRPRTIRASEATHDLQMAEVAIAFYKSGLVAEWMRDDVLAQSKRWGAVVPDAEALLKSGACVVVECGGTYSASKLAQFHSGLTSQMEGLGVHAYQIF